MKMRIATLSLLTIACLALSAPAFADLYNDGPTDGTTNAWYIDIYQVTDSFTVSQKAQMSGFTFAEWVPAGATPLTVDWSVGTSSFGSELGSGVANLNATLLCSSGQPFHGGLCGGGFGFDVYDASVTGLHISLTPGTLYWLTLTNATDSFGGRDGWDENSGPSLSLQNLIGMIPAESFTINGQTPEPGALILFGSGIVGIAGILRRKLF